MNILGSKQESLINITSRVGELYNKFEKYQEKRGNIQEAFSMLRGDIMEEKQSGMYPLHEDKNISIFLNRLKLEGDKLVVILNYTINPTNNLFKDSYQKELVMGHLEEVKIPSRMKLNIENIENYLENIRTIVIKMIRANNNGFNIYLNKELTINKQLCEIDVRDPSYTIYLESLIFRLEDNEQISQDIKRVYKNKENVYVILFSDGSEVRLEMVKGVKGLDDTLHIFGLLENANTILEYETIIQECVVDKYQKAFVKKSKSSTTLSVVKSVLWKIFSFPIPTDWSDDEDDKKGFSNDEGELLKREAIIREIENFYKENIQEEIFEFGVDIGTNNIEYWDEAILVLKDIKKRIGDFLDSKRDTPLIEITMKLIDFWKEIRGGNMSKIGEYIVQNNLLEGTELETLLKKIREIDSLNISEITTKKIFLDPIVQTQEELPYELGVKKEKVVVHSPNKGLLIQDRKTSQEELLIIPGTSASFSSNMKYVLLTEEGKKEKESYSIYDLEERKTIKDLHITRQDYSWHQNIMTNKYFLQVDNESMYIEFMDSNISHTEKIGLDMFEISKDKDSNYIFLSKDRSIVYFDVTRKIYNNLYEIPVDGVLLDLICTEEGFNVVYIDKLSSDIIIVKFARSLGGGFEGEDHLTSNSYTFKGDFQSLPDTIKISPNNKKLLVVRKSEKKTEIKIFDMGVSVEEIITIDEGPNVGQIEFSANNEISYIHGNHVVIVNIDALQVLSPKKKETIPPISDLFNSGIGTVIIKPKRSRNSFSKNRIRLGKKRSKFSTSIIDNLNEINDKIIKNKKKEHRKYRKIFNKSYKNKRIQIILDEMEEKRKKKEEETQRKMNEVLKRATISRKRMAKSRENILKRMEAVGEVMVEERFSEYDKDLENFLSRMKKSRKARKNEIALGIKKKTKKNF